MLRLAKALFDCIGQIAQNTVAGLAAIVGIVSGLALEVFNAGVLGTELLAGTLTRQLTATRSAAAELQGIAPFVGSWTLHDGGLEVDPDGSAFLAYSTGIFCGDNPTPP